MMARFDAARLSSPKWRMATSGALVLAAATLGICPASGQTKTTPPPPVIIVQPPVVTPPAPRQNLVPPPPPPTRPGEGDSTTRINGDYRSRLPAPKQPNQ